MTGKKKWILNLALLISSIGLTLYGVLHGENLRLIWAIIRGANPLYCLLAFGCMMLCILAEGGVIWYLMRALSQRSRLRHCFLFSFVGFFFAAITPSATGGQPLQAYLMKKADIPVSVSVPVLSVVTILYKSVLILISALVLMIRPALIMQYLDPCLFWCYLGLMLNVALTGTLLLFIFRPETMLDAASVITAFIRDVLHVRRAAGWYPRIERWCRKYEGVTKCFHRNGGKIAIAFGITCLQRLSLLLVTWYSCLALGFVRLNPLVVLTLQAMVLSSADMMPLPGGTGVNESLFLVMFTPLLGGVMDIPVMILSRGLSYYSQIAVGGLLTVVAFCIFNRMEKKREENDRLL